MRQVTDVVVVLVIFVIVERIVAPPDNVRQVRNVVVTGGVVHEVRDVVLMVSVMNVANMSNVHQGFVVVESVVH